MKQSVQELVRLCLKKDPAAWEEFVKRYSSLVYWAIERSFKRHHFPFRQEDLEDTFQQFFSHLWEKGLRGAVGVERIEGWLAIVSYRISIDVIRREKKRGRLISFEERLPEKAEGEKLLAEILPDTQKDPRSTLEGKLVGEAVHGVLNVLTEKESSVLRLNLIEEKTHSEISDLLKMPIGTVSSLVKRTKEKVAFLLKRELEGEGGSHV